MNRVDLRKVDYTDWTFLLRWSEDVETARLQGARAAELTEGQAKGEVTRIIAGHGERHLAYMIDVDGVTIGNCWLGHLQGDAASMGIVIGESDYRGHGYGDAALALLLDEARRHGILRVHAWALSTNERALRTYRHRGFRETQRTIRDVPRWGPVETVDLEVALPPL